MIKLLESGRIAADVDMLTCGFRFSSLNAMECDVPSDLSRLFFTPSCIFKVSLLSWLASK